MGVFRKGAWNLQAFIGNGTAEAGGILHNPHYDFNDEVLPLGASYWVRLAESALAKERGSA